MLFKDIIGQENLKNELVKMVSANRIAHALMFLGSEGSGSLPISLAFAQYICCENKQENDSCGECKSCKKFNNFAHPDLHFIFPISKSKETPNSDYFLTEWREILTENPYFGLNDWMVKIGSENKQALIGVEESSSMIKKLNLKSYEADYKIIIIWLPEKMNSRASNKLLKILEEPPEKTLFFLVCENDISLLPTIISRVQIIKLRKLNDNDIKSNIAKKHQLTEDKINQIVFIADGNYNKALILTENNDNLNFNTYRDWMRMCYSGNVLELITWANKFSSEGREKQKGFLTYGQSIIRECLLLNNNAVSMIRLSGEEFDFVKKFSPFINMKNIEAIINEINKAFYHIERNVNQKIVFIDLSLKMNALLRK